MRTGKLPANAYDLVTCRALLHQISDYAPAVLARMAAALKPGGWLLVQEPDFHLAPTTEPNVWASTWKAMIEWGHDNGVDWLIGRELPSMVGALGLVQPQAKTDVQSIRGGIVGHCTSECFLRMCAIGWSAAGGSTRRRSTPPRRCWRTRTTGLSAG